MKMDPPELNQDTGITLQTTIARMVVADGVPDWWASLCETCNCSTVFSSVAWMQSWLEVYGHEFEGQWVRWDHQGSVIGGCLLLTRVSRKWFFPLRDIYLNTTNQTHQRGPLAEYTDILHMPGYESHVLSDALRIVQQMKWHRFYLTAYCQDALVSQLSSRIVACARDVQESTGNYVDLTALSSVVFEKSLVGKSGNQIRRNRRLYESAHGVLDVVRPTNQTDALRYFHELVKLHSLRWEKKGQKGSFATEDAIDFHHRLILRLYPLGNIDLVCIRNEKTLVGYLYNFTFGNKVYFYQSGFAYEHGSNLRPGLLTHALCIEDYRVRGFREYDFLAGTSQYKQSLAKLERKFYWDVIYKDALLPRLYLLVRTMKRNLDRVFRSLS